MRRSYASLSQARSLRLAALWVNGSDADPSVRVNLVWNGKLVEQATVLCSDTEPVFRDLLDKMVAAQNGRRDRTDLPELIAVPQEELDGMLAVNRWFKETPSPAVVMLDKDEGASERSEEWCRLLMDEAARIVEENARPWTGVLSNSLDGGHRCFWQLNVLGPHHRRKKTSINLALVDRNAFLDAELDHVASARLQLVCQLLGGEVVGHEISFRI